MFEVYMLQPVTSACELFAMTGRHSIVREPVLDELMSDPMTMALMAADGVDRDEFDTLLAEVRSKLR